MGALMLLGCILVGYALPTALFFVLFVRKAQLVIIMLASAFFWLLALAVSSLIWAAIPPLRDSTDGWAIVPVGVICQEIARAVFIRMYFFSVVSINAIVFPLIDLWSSLAAGVGFGATQSFVFFAPLIAHSLGSGTLFLPQCSAVSSFVMASVNAALFNALHVLLMVLAFDAFRRVSLVRIGVVLALHAAAAGFTILNNVQDGCGLSFPLVGAVVVITALYTVWVTHMDGYRSSKARRVHSA